MIPERFTTAIHATTPHPLTISPSGWGKGKDAGTGIVMFTHKRGCDLYMHAADSGGYVNFDTFAFSQTVPSSEVRRAVRELRKFLNGKSEDPKVARVWGFPAWTFNDAVPYGFNPGASCWMATDGKSLMVIPGDTHLEGPVCFHPDLVNMVGSDSITFQKSARDVEIAVFDTVTGHRAEAVEIFSAGRGFDHIGGCFTPFNEAMKLGWLSFDITRPGLPEVEQVRLLTNGQDLFAVAGGPAPMHKIGQFTGGQFPPTAVRAEALSVVRTEHIKAIIGSDTGWSAWMPGTVDWRRDRAGNSYSTHQQRALIFTHRDGKRFGVVMPELPHVWLEYQGESSE